MSTRFFSNSVCRFQARSLRIWGAGQCSQRSCCKTSCTAASPAVKATANRAERMATAASSSCTARASNRKKKAAGAAAPVVAARRMRRLRLSVATLAPGSKARWRACRHGPPERVTGLAGGSPAWDSSNACDTRNIVATCVSNAPSVGFLRWLIRPHSGTALHLLLPASSNKHGAHARCHVVRGSMPGALFAKPKTPSDTHSAHERLDI